MRNHHSGRHPDIRDYGCEPCILPIRHATNKNENFRTTLWTGQYMQLTVMSIPVCQSIGVERHSTLDQWIGIEYGCAKVYTGNCQKDLKEIGYANAGDAILIPAGTWHNLVNVGNRPLKLYSLYAPSGHPFGTVHQTKEDAEH